MTTLPSMSLVLPTRGAPGSGLWADAMDAALALIDAHDHTTGKGTRVPTAGMNINADLTFSGLYAPTNLQRASFASVAALSSNNKSIFVGTDHELYWRSNAGANVKLTSNAALNVAAFAGGIGGDYTSVGAAVAFDDAGDRYTFKQQGGVWARMASGDVRLFETGTSDAVFVGLAAPAALASSYTMTFPTALPGSTSLAQVSSAGVISASNTVANAVTLSGGIANNVALTLGATAAVDQSIAISGTGRYKHGLFERHYHISAFQPDGATTYVAFNQIGYITGFSAVCTVQAPLGLDVGKRIVNFQASYDPQGTGAAIQPSIKRINGATGAVTDVALGTSDSTGTGIRSQAVNGINHTIQVGFSYYFSINVTNAAHRVYSAYIAYDEP